MPQEGIHFLSAPLSKHIFLLISVSGPTIYLDLGLIPCARLYFCFANALPSLPVWEQSTLLHSTDLGLFIGLALNERMTVAVPNRGSSGIALGGICVSASHGAPAIHCEKSMPQTAVAPSAQVPEREGCGSDLNLTCSLELSSAELG